MANLEESQDLSFDEIDALLQRAEQRLKDAQQLTSSAKNLSIPTLPKLQNGKIAKPYVQSPHGIARTEARSTISESQRKLTEQPRKIEDPVQIKQQKKKKATILPSWYNLPKTDLTPELKRDLQLLNMRAVLDPKRMYKKQGKLKIPEYSQVGTLIEGPSEFFSARVEKKDRKRTFVEEVLAGEEQSGRFKKKYDEVQNRKRSGKKGFYKALKQRRKGFGKV